MALPTLDATFASSSDLPRREALAKWLVEELGSGTIADYYDLPERLLWAKIAVAAGCPKTEADYASLPKRYVWSDIYNTVAGTTGVHKDWSEKEALGYIAAAYRGDTADAEAVATYISWPWRYQVASIIESSNSCSNSEANVLIDGIILPKVGDGPRFTYDNGEKSVSWVDYDGGVWVYDDYANQVTLGLIQSTELYPWLAGMGVKSCP